MKQYKICVLLSLFVIVMVMQPVSAAAGSIPENIVNERDSKYSYGDMKRDLRQLEQYYPDRVSVMSLGTTADHRKIYCAVLGNPEAKKQIVVQAAIHAREYMNTQIIMEILERYVRNYEKGSCKKLRYDELFDRVAVYIVPMVNPDGVTISQYGPGAIKNKKLRRKVKKIKTGKGSYRRWKANARGVDLNRNFPRGWGKEAPAKKPASQGYPGKGPLSEREPAALDSLLSELPNVRACLSYHSKGRIIYWYVGQKGGMKTRSKKLANLARKTTGYKLVKPGGKYPGRGEFGNYCNMNLEIPNLTIETGKGNCPLGRREFSGIYRQNREMIEKVAYLVR